MCCLTALPYRTEWQNVLFESITLPSSKMCCSKALPTEYKMCCLKEWQNVLLKVPSDKMCCLKALTYQKWHCKVTKCCLKALKALPYRTEWQNVLFESITLPYRVTKCVVWKHYPTIPSDKMCCLKALPCHTEWQNVLFESITLPYRVTKCVVWKHYPTIPSDKMCCLKALTYQVPKWAVWKH